MTAIVALIAYAAITMLLAYLGTRFNWKMLEPESAPYWPVMIPIMIILYALLWACELGERHRRKHTQ